VSRSYRALFLNDDGTLKPEGEAILRDLERECAWMKTVMPITKDGSIDPLRLAEEAARRKVFALIKKRIFEPLEPYRKATETMND
jgi:hypothetical protein